MSPVPDPAMLRLRAALDTAFGARLERVVLFGSRARGDHRPDSDYDVAVFLRDGIDFSRESSLVSDIEVESDTGATINALPLRGKRLTRSGRSSWPRCGGTGSTCDTASGRTGRGAVSPARAALERS